MEKGRLRIARAYTTSSNGNVGESGFQLNLGQGKAAYLHAYVVECTSGIVNNTNYVGIYKKSTLTSDIGDANEVVEDSSWVARHRCNYGAAAYTGPLLQRIQFKFPVPLVLIRSPELVALESNLSAMYAMATIFYTLWFPTEEQLAELMVKDHS